MRKVFNISLPRRGLIILFLLTVATDYIFPRWSDPNQNPWLDMGFAVVEDGSLQIDSYVENTVDFAKLEGFNSLIQAAKARVRGYRTNRNLITMAYLIAGQLKYNLPT